MHKIVVEMEELETCHKFVDNQNDTYVPKGFYNKHGWEAHLADKPNPSLRWIKHIMSGRYEAI